MGFFSFGLVVVLLVAFEFEGVHAKSHRDKGNGGSPSSSSKVPDHLAFMDEDMYELLQTLTLEQKIGQMVQLDSVTFLQPGTYEINQTLLDSFTGYWAVGSFLNSPFSSQDVLQGSQGPKSWFTVEEWREFIGTIQESALKNQGIPIIYGLDSVHGAIYVHNATIFPQQINCAASFNPGLVELMGSITAKDTRAAGIPWIFAPILGIAVQPLWPRVYETFGEDPLLASVMGAAIITGMQGGPPNTTSPVKAAACMKHFIGYSNPRSGKDRTPSWIDDRYLYQYFVPSFRAAVQAGVLTAMESYNEINGIPLASSQEYLVDLLRNTLGFEGMLVTDYQEIENLYYEHHLAESTFDATRISMQETSIDMSMVAGDTTFGEFLLELVQSGVVNESRVDVSAGRVLMLKKLLNLFDEPMPQLPLDALPPGSPEDLDVALQLASESIVLLENNGVLPLAAGTQQQILLLGPSINSIPNLSGGWTIHWQGALSNEDFVGNCCTILQGISGLTNNTYPYLEGCAINGSYTQEQFDAAVNAASQADVVILALGEAPYAELHGDIDDLSLPQGQLDLLQAVIATGTPTVLILVEGRPRVLNGANDGAAAVIWAGLPGPQGGNAIASILFGNTNPSGKLPITYPSATGNAPIQYWHKWSDEPTYDPEWEFGTGLSYTNFTYSDLRVYPSVLDSPNSTLEISLTLSNTGSWVGKETVLVFVSEQWRIVTPEVKMLRAFQKTGLLFPGDVETVEFSIPVVNFGFYGPDDTFQLEASNFTIQVGPLTGAFQLNFTGPVDIDTPSSTSSDESPQERASQHSCDEGSSHKKQDSHQHQGQSSPQQRRKDVIEVTQQEAFLAVFTALVVGFAMGIAVSFCTVTKQQPLQKGGYKGLF